MNWNAAKLQREWDLMPQEERDVYLTELAAAKKELGADAGMAPANRAMKAILDARAADGFKQLRKVFEIFGPVSEVEVVEREIEKVAPPPVVQPRQAGLFTGGIDGQSK